VNETREEGRGGREGEVRMLSFCVFRWLALLSAGVLPVDERKEGGRKGGKEGGKEGGRGR